MQIHAQEHGGPVLGFRTAGAGLDVDKTGVGVLGVVEHAAEFQARHLGFNGLGIFRHGQQGVIVPFGLGHVEQILGVRQGLGHFRQGKDHPFQGLLFPAQLLGPVRIIPNVRAFQFPGDFD